MIRFVVGDSMYLSEGEAEWIDSATGQPIDDGPRESCYWRLRVKNEGFVVPPELRDIRPEVLAVAKAICVTQLGNEKIHGEMRCCQVGGILDCCLESIIPEAEAAIAAYRKATGGGDERH